MPLSTACLVAAIAATQLGTPTAGAAGIFIAVGWRPGEYSSAMVMEVAGEAPAVAKMTAVETATSEGVMGEAQAAECEDRRDGCNFDERLIAFR